jgi:hypothetical protein
MGGLDPHGSRFEGIGIIRRKPQRSKFHRSRVRQGRRF